MSEQKNLFEQIAELRENAEKEKNEPQTFSEQIRMKDPRLISFIERAKLVWKYDGGSLQKKKERKQAKKWFIILSSLFISEWLLFIIDSILISPYLWIGVALTTVFLAPYLYFRYLEIKTYQFPLEVEYDKMPKQRFLRYETDDNGVTNAEGISLLVKVVYMLLALVTVGMNLAVLICAISAGLIPLILSILSYVLWILTLSLPLSKTVHFSWKLCLMDEKNCVEYKWLNEFIYENKIQININKGN